MTKIFLLGLVFCCFFSQKSSSQDLPILTGGVFIAPCGSTFSYSHSPTGSTDPVGFRLSPEIPCLPLWVEIEHQAHIIKDIIQTWVHGPNGWVKIQDSGWHKRRYREAVIIPDWADDVMFVSHNNKDEGTVWELSLICHYPPIEDCCKSNFSLHGRQDTVCPGTEVLLFVDSLVGTPPFLYKWSNGSVDSVISPVVWQTKIVTVTVTDHFGCPGIESFKVNVFPPPIVLESLLVCPGSIVSIPEVAGLIWQMSDTAIQVFRDTTFWGIMIDSHRCEHNIPFGIFVQKRGIVSSDTVVCKNRIIELSTDASGVYSWQNFYEHEISNQQKFFVRVQTDTTFILVNIDSLGCAWRDTVNIQAWFCADAHIYPPNIFAPNSSTDNSIWKVFLDPEAFGQVQIVNLQIFDRWGSMVFKSEGIEAVWDGVSDDDTPAQIGVYVWYAWVTTLEGRFIIKGDLTLVR